MPHPRPFRLLAHGRFPGGTDPFASTTAGVFWVNHTGRLDEARERCRKLLQLDPFNVSGRQVWVGFLLREGNKEEARREFDVIRRLRPPDLAGREEWFGQQTR